MADKFIINRHGGNIVFLSDNGGVLTELASIDSTGLTVQGNLDVQGTTTTIDTEVQLTDQLVITNAGTGPALDVNQTGSQPVVLFKDDGVQVFHIADGGSATIGPTGFGGTHNVRGDVLVTSGNQVSIKQQGASTVRHEIQSSGARRGYFEVEDSGDEVRFGSITNTKVGFYTNFSSKGEISAAGAWTFGASGSAENHTFNGNFSSFRGDANAARTWSIVNSNIGTNANARLMVAGQNQAVQAILEARGTAGTPVGAIVGTTTNHNLTFFTNTTNVGSVDTSGQWIFGPSAGGALVHQMQSGNLTAFQINAGGSNNIARLTLNSSGTTGVSQFEMLRAGSTKWQFSNNASDTLEFFSGATGIVGTTTSAGAWVFGSSGSSVTHTINGNLSVINQSGHTLTLSKLGDAPALKFEGGVGLDYSIDINSGTLRFYNDSVAITGTLSQAGAWTFGPSASASTSHTVRGALNIDRAASTRSELNIYKNGSSRFTLAAVQGAGDVIPGTANDDIAIRSENTHIHFSANGGGTNHGSLLNTGVWTLGASGFVGTHTINGTANVTGRVSTNTGFGTQTNASPSSTTSFIAINNAAYRVTIFSTNSSTSARIGEYIFVGLNKGVGTNPTILTLGTIGSPEWTFSYALSGGNDTLVTVNAGADNQGTRVIVEKIAAG